jgi:hypothetical protein
MSFVQFAFAINPSPLFNYHPLANRKQISQWLIAQLVERSLSVMKDPGQISARTFVLFIIDL